LATNCLGSGGTQKGGRQKNIGPRNGPDLFPTKTGLGCQPPGAGSPAGSIGLVSAGGGVCRSHSAHCRSVVELPRACRLLASVPGIKNRISPTSRSRSGQS